jgi:pimeloyl-ACP methyl ester carboxylesterase
MKKIIMIILFLFASMNNVHSEIVDLFSFLPDAVVYSVDSVVKGSIGRNANWPVDPNTQVTLYSKGRHITEMKIPDDLRRVWDDQGCFYKLENKQNQVKGNLIMHFKIINPEYLEKTSEVILGIPGFFDNTYSLEQSCKIASDMAEMSAVVIDPIGSGKSYIPSSKETFTAIDNKDCILEFISGMNFSKVYVVGNSLGGMYSLLSMVDQPDLFGGGVLISPVVYNIREKPNKYLWFLNYFKLPYNGHAKEILYQNPVSTFLMINKFFAFGLMKSVRSDFSMTSWISPSVWYERWSDVKHYTNICLSRSGLVRFQIENMDWLLTNGQSIENQYSSQMKNLPEQLRENLCLLFSPSDEWVREWQMYKFLSEVRNVKYCEDNEVGHWAQMVKPEKVAELIILTCFPDKVAKNNITGGQLNLKSS